MTLAQLLDAFVIDLLIGLAAQIYLTTESAVIRGYFQSTLAVVTIHFSELDAHFNDIG